MLDSKLYPYPISYFATLEEAVAYALEIKGYRELWLALVEAEMRGDLNPN